MKLPGCEHIISEKIENFNITIHAGEAFGKESIWQAIQFCGAHRIGHATRLLEDVVLDKDGDVVSLGELSQYVLDKRLPLEIFTQQLSTTTWASHANDYDIVNLTFIPLFLLFITHKFIAYKANLSMCDM